MNHIEYLPHDYFDKLNAMFLKNCNLQNPKINIDKNKLEILKQNENLINELKNFKYD